MRANPEVLLDVMGFGFNMTTFNNNHAFDFSYEGFYSTLDALDESGIVHAGAGYSLAEASAPRFLDTAEGRVALISVCTSFDAPMIAGNPSSRVQARPGINGMRVEQYVSVSSEELECIRNIAKRTGINVPSEIVAKEGYGALSKADECKLDTLVFKAGDEDCVVQSVKKEDMERLEKSIYEAKLTADYIIVSVHSHQLWGGAKEIPAPVLETIAHSAIDFGANAVLGHGPHLLRPIEIYKDSPIFYSLGDFILQLYSVEFAPADFFEKQALDPDSTVHELLKKRSRDFTIGLMTDRRMFISVLPIWQTDEGKLTSLRLVPIEMRMSGNKALRGLPRISDAKEICDCLGSMSKKYGVRLTVADDGLIDCHW